MTTLSRKERHTSQKPTKQKWYQRTNYLVITMATVVALIPILSIITLYRDTKEWSNSTVTEPLNTLAPEYVLNYPTTDSKQLRELVSETNKYLDEVMAGETPDLTEILSKTQKLLDENKLTSGQLYDNYIRLQQYQNVLSFVNTAYSKPDSSTLSTLLSTQEQYVIDHQRDGDKKLLEKLYTINNDYSSVYYFYTSILPQYGTIEGNKLIVSKNVTGFAEIKGYAEVLSKFKTAQTLMTALTKQESSIVDNNQALIDYAYYIEMKEKTVGLLDLYTRVSDIKTYADAVKNGWTVPNNPDTDTKVLSIQLNGVTLNSSDYIRLSANPTIILETHITLPSSTSSSSSTSTTTSTGRTGEETTIPSTSSSMSTTIDITEPTSTTGDDLTIPGTDESSTSASSSDN